MDPVTRRYAWDIIEDTKKGRAIVLTTHSMEEADILSDRIAIMARGKLQCIGTSIRLKSRFGSRFVVNVSVEKETTGNNFLKKGNDSLLREGSGHQSEPVKRFFREHLNVEPKQENKAYITFIIPREKRATVDGFIYATARQTRQARDFRHLVESFDIAGSVLENFQAGGS